MFISSAKRKISSAELLRLISDQTRLRILSTLFRENRHICVGELASLVGASHSATSHQLARLEAYNIVSCFRDGQMMCYEYTADPIVGTIKNILKILGTI